MDELHTLKTKYQTQHLLKKLNDYFLFISDLLIKTLWRIQTKN